MTYNKEITETKDFFLSVIESAPYGIITIDSDGLISMANSQAIFSLDIKWNRRDVVGKNIGEIILQPSELKIALKSQLSNGIKDFDLKEINYQDKFYSYRGRKILSGMIVTIDDITSIKEAEYNALNSLLEGQEYERKRLAREIHDGIGPILSTLKMNLANIEGDVENLIPELREKFKKSYEMIDEASNDLRSISHNLMPKVLSDFGLVEALETFCEKINVTINLEIDFINTGLSERLDVVTELGLYRITQELVNNTLKHAKANKITIQLIKRENTIQLMYEDNGIGFDSIMASDGMGLFNIENRTKALAGRVTVDSQKNNGMTAIIEIPLS